MVEIIVAILIILALAIAVVLILALRKPDTFRVQRAASIDAPPEKNFFLISDFHQWKGNRNVGSGRMEILDAPPERIVIKLDFISPFEAHNIAEFTFAPHG